MSQLCPVSCIITVGPLIHNLPFIGDRMSANSDTYGWFVHIMASSEGLLKVIHWWGDRSESGHPSGNRRSISWLNDPRQVGVRLMEPTCTLQPSSLCRNVRDKRLDARADDQAACRF
jgi:hypothetical protein